MATQRSRLLTITCPPPQQVSSFDGAPVPVSWPDATTTGGRGWVRVTYTPPRGSLFPVGNWDVEARAESRDGQMTTCFFPVTVIADSVVPPPVIPDYGPDPTFVPPAGVSIFPNQNPHTIVAANPAGTFFIFKAGTHRLQDWGSAAITARTNDRYYGEPGAIVSGAKVLTGWTFDGTNYFVTGQTSALPAINTDCRVAAGSGVAAPFYPRCDNREDVFYDGVPLRHVASLAEMATGTFFFDYAADRIYIRDTPTGHTLETSVIVSAFGGSATGVRMENLVLEKFANARQTAPFPTSASWTWYRDEVRHCHGIGVRIGATWLIQRCKLWKNGQMGFGGSGAGAIIEDSEIAWNNYAGYNDYWEAGGCKITHSDNVTIRRCWFHHNSGPGLWYDIDNTNATIHDNVVEYNFRMGIFYEISWGRNPITLAGAGTKIYNNTCRGNGMGLAGDGNPGKMFPFWVEGAGIAIVTSHGKGANGIEVYNNTCIDNWQQIVVIDDHRGGTSIYGIPYDSGDTNVHDNVVQNTAHPGTGGGRSGIHDTSGTGILTSNVQFEANDYTLPANGINYFFRVGSGEITDGAWLGFGYDTPDGSITRV